MQNIGERSTNTFSIDEALQWNRSDSDSVDVVTAGSEHWNLLRQDTVVRKPVPSITHMFPGSGVNQPVFGASRGQMSTEQKTFLIMLSRHVRPCLMNSTACTARFSFNI